MKSIILFSKRLMTFELIVVFVKSNTISAKCKSKFNRATPPCKNEKMYASIA